MTDLDYFTIKCCFPLKIGVSRISYEGVLTKYSDKNGTADLPISVSSLSRINELKKIKHKHLVKYIDAFRAKNENLYIVTEHLPLSLDNVKSGSMLNKIWLKNLYHECLMGLKYLSSFDIVHGCIKPQDILITSKGHAKLSGYGTFYANNWCNEIKYPLNYACYTPPEIFIIMCKPIALPISSDHVTQHPPVDSRTDLWSLSLIFLELIMGKEINQFHSMDRNKIVHHLLKSLVEKGDQCFIKYSDLENFKDDDITHVFLHTLSQCTFFNPRYRFSLSAVLNKIYGTKKQTINSFYSMDNCLCEKDETDPNRDYTHLELLMNENVSPSIAKAIDFLNLNGNLTEIFHFWSLCGGNLEKTWSKSVMEKYQSLYGDDSVTDEQFFSHNRPPILDLPMLLSISENKNTTLPNNKIFVHESHWSPGFNKSYFRYDPTVFPLPCERLIYQLARIPMDKLYPSLLDTQSAIFHDLRQKQQEPPDLLLGVDPIESFQSDLFSVGVGTNARKPGERNVMENQPLLVKESDACYQICRIRLFNRLLCGLPATEVRLKMEARIDIPPFLRAKIWAALLGVHRNFNVVGDYIGRLSMTGLPRLRIGSSGFGGPNLNASEHTVDVEVESAHALSESLVVMPSGSQSDASFPSPQLLSVESKADSISGVLDMKSWNQIAVDLPRCHSYEPLIAAPLGQAKLRRVLTSVLVDSRPKNEYTQGMDSVAAVFTRLCYADEALASACLHSLLVNRLPRLFTTGGFTLGIKAYFVILRRLLAFHMPLLSCHFDALSVPLTGLTTGWMYTLFAHSIPLRQAERLWDCILPGPSSMPMFLYLAVFKQLDQQVNLTSLGLEEICMLLSNFPEINLDECRKDALMFGCNTPESLLVEPDLPKCPLLIPFDDTSRRLIDENLNNTWPVHLDESELHDARNTLLRSRPSPSELHPLSPCDTDEAELDDATDWFAYRQLTRPKPRRARPSQGRRTMSALSQHLDPEASSRDDGSIPVISPKDLLRHYSRPDCLVIDLRPPDLYENGCLIGSINFYEPQIISPAPQFPGLDSALLGALPGHLFPSSNTTSALTAANDHILRSLVSHPRWRQAASQHAQAAASTQSRQASHNSSSSPASTTLRPQPGLLIVLPGGEEDEIESGGEAGMERGQGLAKLLIAAKLNHVCVAQGGVTHLLQCIEHSSAHFIPKAAHPDDLFDG